MRLARDLLASCWCAVSSAAVHAADKADQPIEQVSGSVVVGFLIFCVVGIAAWIYYTSKASKKEQRKE